MLISVMAKRSRLNLLVKILAMGQASTLSSRFLMMWMLTNLKILKIVMTLLWQAGVTQKFMKFQIGHLEMCKFEEIKKYHIIII